MTVDNIVEEFWDEKLGGLRWVRESGDSTVVFQARGLDIVVTQTRDGKDSNAWCYSEPGLLLFAAMLKFHKQINGEIPLLEDIQHIFGERYESRECGYPVDRHSMNFIFKYDFPVAEQGRIIFPEGQMIHLVGGYMGGVSYAGFIEDAAFVISVPDVGPEVESFSMRDGALKKSMTFNKSILLYPDCAVRLMKAVNLFYPDKDFLNSSYRQSEELAEDWIHEDIRKRYG